VQIEYSPFTMDIENPKIGLLKACRELGVAVVAYSPLGRGFLTGKYRSPDDFGAKDMRKFLPRFSPENFNKNLELVDKLGAVAKEMKISVGVLTLAWLLAQGHDIIPIPGTTKRSHFEENLKALRVQLSAQNNALIRALVNEANIFGDRYDAR
jgi:aryl-alcohol dehydrogenase-like predicted oxidoreductase